MLCPPVLQEHDEVRSQHAAGRRLSNNAEVGLALRLRVGQRLRQAANDSCVWHLARRVAEPFLQVQGAGIVTNLVDLAATSPISSAARVQFRH